MDREKYNRHELKKEKLGYKIAKELESEGLTNKAAREVLEVAERYIEISQKNTSFSVLEYPVDKYLQQLPGIYALKEEWS